MAETEQLGDQRADSQRKLQDEIASFISSIEDARKKNRKEIQDHQAAIHVSAFLSKKYKASGVVPSRSQLESYAAEFNGSCWCYAVPNVVKLLTKHNLRRFYEVC